MNINDMKTGFYWIKIKGKFTIGYYNEYSKFIKISYDFSFPFEGDYPIKFKDNFEIEIISYIEKPK